VIADRVLVEKSQHKLTLYRAGVPLKSYSVALGKSPTGAKRFEGDARTPEGLYLIDFHKADSAFHRALHISYPSQSDTAFAQAQGKQPGGAIMVHGLRNGLGVLGPVHRMMDWTNGCIAVTDREIEEIWRAVPDGTPIEILP
jgi:murein L,D-transpeptidase YafK